jgi:hypothetical protein
MKKNWDCRLYGLTEREILKEQSIIFTFPAKFFDVKNTYKEKF